jgi:hypothetical protein
MSAEALNAGARMQRSSTPLFQSSRLDSPGNRCRSRPTLPSHQFLPTVRSRPHRRRLRHPPSLTGSREPTVPAHPTYQHCAVLSTSRTALALLRRLDWLLLPEVGRAAAWPVRRPPFTRTRPPAATWSGPMRAFSSTMRASNGSSLTVFPPLALSTWQAGERQLLGQLQPRQRVRGCKYQEIADFDIF